MSILAKHPILTFTAGVAAGYLVHKYRQEIIEAASGITDRSKEFVLQQQEHLADILAETKEAGEAMGE